MENSGESIPEPGTEEAAPAGRLPQTTPVLPQLGILAGLSETSLANLASYGRYHRCPIGTEIMREGEMQDRFYVVVTGELDISTRTSGLEVTLNVTKAGECVGELNLLEPGPASATVRVAQDATLWSMDIGELRSFIFEHTSGAAALLLGMAVCMSQRIRQANRLIAKNHVPPIETLPKGQERAITADNTPVQLGLFERIKQKLAGEKKIRISTKIKM
jgi:CRP/FNR family transcriptional regulator, cyclic AMP receptor protein